MGPEKRPKELDEEPIVVDDDDYPFDEDPDDD